MPSVQVQVLPPSDSYRYEPPHFDDHQFQQRSWKQRLVAFSDTHNMSVERHKQTQERRLPTPDWALNDVQLREVLVRYMERRAMFLKPQTGTLKHRLQRAEKAIAARSPELQAKLRSLVAEYVSLKKARCKVGHKVVKDGRCKWRHAVWEPTDRLRELEIDIQGIDTQLCIIRRGVAATVVAIVYRYYRLGYDSVTIAEQLGIVSATVHQVIWKMARLAEGSVARAQGSSRGKQQVPSSARGWPSLS